MRKHITTAAVAMVLTLAMTSYAFAGDEFEDGFKTELGAIAARSAVGLGFGLVHGAVHGGHGHYEPVHYRPHRPHYRTTVVYRHMPPPPPRRHVVEHRVYHYPARSWYCGDCGRHYRGHHRHDHHRHGHHRGHKHRHH